MIARKGGIKTNILLLSLLICISFLLFFFVQSVYLENRNVAIQELYNVNSCIDVKFSILNTIYNNNQLSYMVKNNYDSIDIDKVTTFIDGEKYNHIIMIKPGEIRKILIENVKISHHFQTYPNNCNGLIETTYID